MPLMVARILEYPVLEQVTMFKRLNIISDFNPHDLCKLKFHVYHKMDNEYQLYVASDSNHKFLMNDYVEVREKQIFHLTLNIAP